MRKIKPRTKIGNLELQSGAVVIRFVKPMIADSLELKECFAFLVSRTSEEMSLDEVKRAFRESIYFWEIGSEQYKVAFRRK